MVQFSWKMLVAAALLSLSLSYASTAVPKTSAVDDKSEAAASSSSAGRKCTDADVGKTCRATQEILGVIRSNTQGRLVPLYNGYLRLRPRFGGKMKVKLKIAAAGNVETAEILETSTDYAEFEQAVIKDVLQWTFSKIDSGSTKVTIPLTFSDDQ